MREATQEWNAGHIDTAPPPLAHAASSAVAKDVKRLAKGASIALVGRLIGRCVRLAGDVILAHILGPATFGIYAIGWTITRIATSLTPLGLDSGVIRFASPHRSQNLARVKGVILQSLQFSALSGLLLGAAFYILSPWLAVRVFHQSELIHVFHWFAFAFPLITILTVASAVTRVSQRMQFSVYAELIGQPAAAVVLLLVLYLCGYRLGGAVAAFVLSCGFALALALHYVRKLFPEVFSKKIEPTLAGKELILFSLPASLSVMFGMLMLWVDRLFVGMFRTSTEVGIYHAASQLAITLGVILSAFGAIINPMIAELFHCGEKKRLEELFRVCTKWSLYVSIPPFLVMCFVPRDAVTVIFGRPYAAGWELLPILGIGQLINSGTGPAGALLIMTGHQNQLSLLNGTMFLANIVCAILLVPRLGMLGAAIGTALTVGLVCIISTLMARAFLKLWPYDARYWKGLLATGIAAAALFALRQLPITSPFLILASAAAVSVAVFIVALMLQGLDVEDREFLDLIVGRILRQQRG